MTRARARLLEREQCVEIGRNRARILLLICHSLRWSAALRENSQNAWKPQSYRRGEAIALDIEAPLGPQDCGVSGRRNRRLGRRPRCLQEASGRAAVGQRHGLHHRAAPRPQPRQHDGGSACGPYLDAGLAGDRRNGDRARARLCHSAWRLSVGRRQGRVADFEAGGTTRRAASFRLPFEFPRSRIWRARDLRGPFRNRRRRQSWPEVGKGERRSRHRPGHPRSRL